MRNRTLEERAEQSVRTCRHRTAVSVCCLIEPKVCEEPGSRGRWKHSMFSMNAALLDPVSTRTLMHGGETFEVSADASRERMFPGDLRKLCSAS